MELALFTIVRGDLGEIRKSRAWKSASIFIPSPINNIIDILTDRNGASALIVAFALLLSRALDGGVAFAVVGLIVFVAADLNDRAVTGRWRGTFLALFFPTLIASSLAAAAWSSHLRSWGTTGPLLLFLILFTALVAPFNWATLGFTRLLMRRALELGGWWPYFLGLVDACIATVVATYTSLTIVIGTQAFDELAVRGGGEKAAVLPLLPLFDGIATNPGAPEYWWVYAFLLSTMIPSLTNFTIGSMALTRGVPGVSRMLLRWIPEGREVPDYRRPLVAIVLAGQMFAGAFLGIAALAQLAWGLLFHLMPAVGLDLLWLCQKLAELDLPGKFFHLTGIIR